MTIEKRNGFLGSLKDSPIGAFRGERTWSPIEIPGNEYNNFVTLKRKGKFFELSRRRDGMEMVTDITTDTFGMDEDINRSNTPWFGEIRWVRVGPARVRRYMVVEQ